MKKIVWGLFLGILLSFFQVMYPMMNEGVEVVYNKNLQLKTTQNYDRRGRLAASDVLAKANFNPSNNFRIDEEVIARVDEGGYVYGKVFIIKNIGGVGRLAIDFGDCGARDIPRTQVGKLQN